MSYQAIGSSGGIKQIEAKRVTFGATDKPLGNQKLTENGLIQFPTLMGGIVPVINVDGVKTGEMVLDGPTLAKIFLGEITAWDEDAIKQLNPLLNLPREAITVVHRSDGSGTTFNFTHYLSKASSRSRSNGRSASARKAIEASAARLPIPRGQSALSNLPTPNSRS